MRIKKILFFLLFFMVFIFLLDRFFPLDISPVEDVSVVIKDKNDKWLYVQTNSKDKWRFAVDVERLDPRFVKMLLAYEDKRFYTHFGVDPLAIIRAIGQLLKHRRVVSGASTITMQLAKLLHPRPRTLWSKTIEMFRAFELEWYYSKKQILSMYLTLTPYGGNVEGVLAASMRYFAKQPTALTASQMALLVALPKSPERNRPDKHLHYATQARDKVLTLAHHVSLINDFEYKQSIKKQLDTKIYAYPRHAQHLAQKILSKNSTTTLDFTLQTQLEKWAKSKASSLDKGTTLALLVVSNKDASVEAYLGSHDMFSPDVQGYIDMVQAIRSPGSTLKPFIYALGFEQHRIHPYMHIYDEETRFSDYVPHNFNHTYTGEVEIAYALQHSLNIPAVKVLRKIGAKLFVQRVKNYVGKLYIPKQQVSLPIALGGLGLSMWQLSQLYVALANDGKSQALHYFPKASEEKRLFTLQASRMTTAILREMTPPKGFTNKNKHIAYKTGTSYGYRDAWTIAYSQTHTVAVWVGKPNNGIQLKKTGLSVAAPLAFEVFSLIEGLMPSTSWTWGLQEVSHIAPEGLKMFDVKKEQKREKFDFLYPKVGSRFMSAGCKDAMVEIVIQNGKAPYYWFIDATPKEVPSKKLNLRFKHGGHTIDIMDSNGATISRSIWVDKPEC